MGSELRRQTCHPGIGSAFPVITLAPAPGHLTSITGLMTISTRPARMAGTGCREDRGAVDFGGGEGQFTTWDGEPISREPPHGATVVVASRAPGGWRYVLLHRAHRGPAWEGDWAWTPPSGSRKPGEEVAACAARELREETGLRAAPRPVAVDGVDRAVFSLEIPWGHGDRGRPYRTRQSRMGRVHRGPPPVPASRACSLSSPSTRRVPPPVSSSVPASL